MRVIITGGTGLIGKKLSQIMSSDGHDVIVLSRNPGKAVGMPSTVRVEKWDTQSLAGWGKLVDGADAIVNLAGAGIADGRWSRSRRLQQSVTMGPRMVTKRLRKITLQGVISWQRPVLIGNCPPRPLKK